MPVSKIDRLRWRLAVALAPKVQHPIAPAGAADTFRALLEGLGHKVSKARGGDPEVSAIISPLFREMPNPYDAKIAVTTIHARTVVREVVKMIDRQTRVTLIGGRRACSTFHFDSAVLPKLQPHRDDEPDIVPPARRISPRSGRDICHYCKTAPGLTMDHVAPLSLGGANLWWNVVSACKKCNVKKGNYAPTCQCDFCLRAVELFLAGYRTA